MAKAAFLYPGQGAQAVGMGEAVYAAGGSGRTCLAQAAAVYGPEFLEGLFHGSQEELTKTVNAQPALFAVEMALTAALQEVGIKADGACGLSLGEYAALCAAGVFSYEEGLRLVRERGRLMGEGCAGKGKMAAVLGCDEQSLTAKVAGVAADSGEIVAACNFNCPGQIVIGGTDRGVDLAVEALTPIAKRILPLQVEGPFHTALLTEAATAFRPYLEQVNWQPESIPVYANVTGRQMEGDKTALLVHQMSEAVRFEDDIRSMIADGFDTFIEVGPGKILSGFIKKIDRSLQVRTVATPQDIADLVQEWENLT
ncbi:MAG: ACP S-malonyltransferase [Lachnospiraceae bacterium]|nr:ACP S-malonyltransferase [Lachnospiraceae bacterium]MDY5743018.1 ACP S-malonyltransferase [Lachnospiraceae bacterium]